MRVFFLICCFLSLGVLPGVAQAAVDMGLRGKDPLRIEDVYQQKGVPYIAVEDALDVVGLKGHWNSIDHTFKIQTRRGWAEISPASSYMKLGDEFYPLKDKPRFIDGRLRVTDSFILNQLSQLAGQPVYFRNLDPDADSVPEEKKNSLEQLFSFLLNRKPAASGPLIRAVALDPGHGGLDTGVLAASGYKEKELNLAVAEKLAKQLKMKLGIPVYLSRDGDYELAMDQRLKAASRDDVDAWILLHAQSSFSPLIHGVNLFIRPEQPTPKSGAEDDAVKQRSQSFLLASQVALALRSSAVEVQGIYPSNRLSLGQGNLPTVLIELGYLSNSAEEKQLENAEYQRQLAEAIFNGIKNYATQMKEQQNAAK